MSNLLAVILGGGVGAALRYSLSRWLLSFQFFTNHSWSVIMLINVVGSFIMGALFVVISKHLLLSAFYRHLLLIGLLGGFTTFSSFSIDTVSAIEIGNMLAAVLNVICTVFGSLAMCLLGVFIAQSICN